MAGLREASWSDIEALRAQLVAGQPESVQEAAQQFAAQFAARFSTIVLVRLFLVVPFDLLPPLERDFARALIGDAQVTGRTPVLTLLGTRGRNPEWNDRRRSMGHLAIPLLDRESIQAAPMIARLLEDLDADIQGLETGSIATRRMIGGKSGMFYVPDARGARDERGRPIISADFVAEHGVQSVFGMGGAYLDGTLAIAILFCAEHIGRADADRYGSFINSFKAATIELKSSGRIWPA